MKKINLALMIPINNDPTSWYRGIGPFAALQKSNPDLNFIFIAPNPVECWPTLKLSDILFVQRPATPEQYQCIMYAKDLGLPVWADFDDDNLSVPKDNPMYPMYSQQHIKEAIVRIARSVDVLTVSTERLRKKYSIYNPNVFVVPNAVDDVLLRFREIAPFKDILTTPREKVLLWRGTGSHNRNLKTIETQIINLAHKYKDWFFTFYGIDPIDITDGLRNARTMPLNLITDFHKTMINLHVTALYYALASNDHSQSRSHVCWLEASYAGAATIAPDILEFQKPGILNFSTPDEFQSVCESVMTGQVDIDKHAAESWDCIMQNFLLSKVNLQRQDILTRLSELVK